MSERWVCKRCFADNEAGDGSCRQCGLTRGSEAPADQASWAAARPEAPKPSRRQGWLRYWWVPVLAISLVVGFVVSVRRDDSGAISSGGTLAIEDLHVGDCFTLGEEEADAVSEVEAKPCGEAHEYELFHVANWTDPASGYPTDDAMTDFIVAECLPAFERYVGTGFEESQLDFVHFVPVEEGWDAGDRLFQCALFDPASATLTESLEGAER